MDACTLLARQTSFAVYAGIRRKKLSVKRMQEFCAAATVFGLGSLANHASMVKLYQGQGGRLIEGTTLAGLAHEPPTNDEPPPQYSEPPTAEPTRAALDDCEFKLVVSVTPYEFLLTAL